MNPNKTTLYIKDNTGNVRWWEIQADYVNKELRISHGVLGGEVQHQFESVCEGKAARSVDEQIISRMNSRINRKLDKGYVRTVEQAKFGRPVNILGLSKPMLARKFDINKEYINLDRAFVQYKYDGHRCLITNNNGKITAYSRGGRIINSIDHIISNIPLAEGDTIDGELYVHGLSLQNIGSLIKRQQQGSTLLRFHCYDLMTNEPFSERFELLKAMDLGAHVDIVPTWTAESVGLNYSTIYDQTAEAKALGYEGLMLRFDGPGYEDGRRSKQLVKVKLLHDEEFMVTGIDASKDDWAVLECLAPNGRKFKVTAPGTVPEKEYVLLNREKYIRREVRVEFASYTDDGLPFHPVATGWRNKQSE